MKEKNNSEAPSSVLLNRGNAFLSVFHVLVLGISVQMHLITETGAHRALP